VVTTDRFWLSAFYWCACEGHLCSWQGYHGPGVAPSCDAQLASARDCSQDLLPPVDTVT